MTDFTIVYGRFLSDDLAGINSYTELQNTISYRRCERNTGNAQRDIYFCLKTRNLHSFISRGCKIFHRLLLCHNFVNSSFTRSSSNKWTETLYRDYLHRFANVCVTVLNIFSKEIISNKTKWQNNFWSSYETLDSMGEMKLTEILELIFFSRVLKGKCFGVSSRNNFNL